MTRFQDASDKAIQADEAKEEVCSTTTSQLASSNLLLVPYQRSGTIKIGGM